MMQLEAIACDGEPIIVPLSATFGESGGSIGRAMLNTLTLPDQQVSRSHANILFTEGSGFAIRDLGGPNPTRINGQLLNKDQEALLANGDQIEIGPYLLRARIEWSDPAKPPNAKPSPSKSDDPFGPRVELDPDTPRPIQQWPPDEPGPRGDQTPPDPFPIPDPEQGAPPFPGIPHLPTHWNPHGNETAENVLLGAFLKGAGIADFEVSGGLTPQLMTQLGQLLREFTQGTVDFLHARAAVKKELGVPGTIVGPTDNNPLKYSPDAEFAIRLLLSPPARGFLPPAKAVHSAYNDLRLHQFAFVAGMRATIAGILAGFSPTRLEERISRNAVIDSLVPIHRKARLWEAFETLYKEMVTEADDSVQAFLDREFPRAYEAQVAEMKPGVPLIDAQE